MGSNPIPSVNVHGEATDQLQIAFVLSCTQVLGLELYSNACEQYQIAMACWAQPRNTKRRVVYGVVCMNV